MVTITAAAGLQALPGRLVAALSRWATVYGATGRARQVHESAGHTLVKLPDALSYKTGAAISCGTEPLSAP